MSHHTWEALQQVGQLGVAQRPVGTYVLDDPAAHRVVKLSAHQPQLGQPAHGTETGLDFVCSFLSNLRMQYNVNFASTPAVAVAA